ncbi:serine hydrolase domain-containing protein [Cognatiluteimonas weifangensis]|uniref:Class A beta-lactamase-related serine hydrolase n=1 Tax=Cognatiluteimonas weifangensis TaxID=2303539 RepID=A0A372DT56_9GAMM|nr:class A beta-lactamase-related serine hydrolase [Luteimonas weifangensis]
MKDDPVRTALSVPEPLPHRWRKHRLAALALLLPLALGSAAQTPLRWSSPSPATQLATVVTAPARSAPVAPHQIAYVPPPPRAMPLATGFDVQRFEAMAQALVAGQRVPGLAMAIVKDGHILSARGYGITAVDAAEPVDAHTVFRLASLSKAFAGTVAGLLVSEGALRWDSRVADFMPELQFSQPGAAQQLTVAEVLSHRVGLPQNAYDRDIENNADYRSLVRRLAAAPMKCAPGQCYAYQNVAFSLIGDVVFAATGRFFSEAVARRIFKPLGMDDASYGLDGIEGSPRWARPHVRGRNGWVALTPKPTYYRVAPAAGVNASISDMAQWLIAQTGHRPDVLPESLLATLHAPVVDTPAELRGSSWRRERLGAAGYGIGWRVYDYAGHRVVFHGGAVQGYRASIALLPERDLGVALLWNSSSSAPGGLLPTILDSAIGLPTGDWLELDQDDVELLYAQQQHAPQAPSVQSGSDDSVSRARPE